MSQSRTARSRIQRFEVVDQLGAGGMGAVYRARDPQLGRTVAIKVLADPAAQVRAGLSAHDTVDLRGGAPAGELLEEARMMARLSHPNVLPVYEVGLADGEVFVVMEHIAGSDLRTWLAGPRSTRSILEAFAQAARGLAAAHAHGIIHRDFKPENVLVGDDGRIRVADFGLSRLTSHGEPPLRVEQTVGGTPYYMAPELRGGGSATVRSDVFALCTALAEALGNGPESRERLDRDLRSRGVARRLRAAIASGLAEDPRARPALDDVIAALAPTRPRWLLAAAAAAGAAGLAIALAGEPAPCQADRVHLAGRWDGDRLAALAAVGADRAIAGRRRDLDEQLRAACSAEERGELTVDQARTRTSCLERRGIELDAIASVVADRSGDAAVHPIDPLDTIGELPAAKECDRISAPPLPGDRAPVAALYRRLVATTRMPLASAARTAELAAVEQAARALGERELEARAAVSLGMRQIETDQLAAADASLARGQERATAIGATRVAVVALVKRGVAAERRGDPAVAHTYGRLALELVDEESASAGTRVLVYHAVARGELARGQPSRAVQLLEDALRLLRTEIRDPRREIDVRFALIDALLGLDGRVDRALALARETVELARSTLGEGHADYGVALNILALTLRYRGDPAGALDVRRRALAVMERSLPAGHSGVLGQRMNVANDLYANGRFEEARAEAAAIVALAADNETARSFRPTSIADLGAMTFATGRTVEGMRLFEQGLDELVSQVGQDHPDALDYRLERVDFELELGELDDAERHMDALERSYRARADRGLALVLLDGFQRAQLALARRRPRDAEARARAALAGWQELRGDDEDREDLLRVLGTSLNDQGRHGEAMAVLAAATAITSARREQDDRFALIDVERARALASLGRTASSVTLAQSARAALERYPGRLRARAAADALLARLRRDRAP